MAKEPGTIITIEAGSANVRVLVAQKTASGELQLRSRGETPSLGVQRGIVTNVDDASFAIKAALEEAGAKGATQNAQLYASIGGKHLSFINHYGEVKVSRSDGLVTEKDVNGALAASRVSRTGEETLIHAIPRNFRVDGYLCRRNPIGMYGATVGADSHIVVAGSAAVRNLRKAILMAGKDVDRLVANGIAASQAVLTTQEKEMGVVLVDIGAGTTNVMAFSAGAPFHTSCLPVGGNQMANDLAIALNTSFHVAERLYREQGSGSSEGISPSDELTAACFGLTGTRTLRRLFLNDIIKLRLMEVLRMAYIQAKISAPELPLAAGVVLTGGVANLPKIEVLAKEALQVPVRVGRPGAEPAIPSELADPSFATAIGTLHIALDPAFDMLKARKSESPRGFGWRPVWQALKPRAV